MKRNPLFSLFFCLSLSFSFLGCQVEAETQESVPAEEVVQEAPVPLVPSSYLLGRFEPAQDSLFVQLRNEHTAGSGRGAYLHKETYAAYIRMFEAAQKDGVSLIIKSATRNFWRQKAIWEGKWNGDRLVEGKNLAREVSDPVERARWILRYSSMPGTSRHHWGTDIDLNAFENSYFSSGKGLKEYEWLQKHAATYGFCQTYTAKGPERPQGYEEEKWHWSYLPVSVPYLKAYEAQITADSIRGFAGAESAAGLEVIKNYVGGINLACK
ncbi:MAG: M15 family metallopeptidase [Bacteroidota bacterium]